MKIRRRRISSYCIWNTPPIRLCGILNTDRLNYLLDKEIDTFIDNRLCKFKLVFKGREKKRSDAKTETDFYTIFINGIDFITQYPRDTYYRLIMGDGANVFLPSNKDKLIIVDF